MAFCTRLRAVVSGGSAVSSAGILDAREGVSRGGAAIRVYRVGTGAQTRRGSNIRGAGTDVTHSPPTLTEEWTGLAAGWLRDPYERPTEGGAHRACPIRFGAVAGRGARSYPRAPVPPARVGTL